MDHESPFAWYFSPNIAAGMIQSGDRIKVFRNASIDGGEVTFWVMNRRADHWLPWPVFTQYLSRLALPGAAVKGQSRHFALRKNREPFRRGTTRIFRTVWNPENYRLTR